MTKAHGLKLAKQTMHSKEEKVKSQRQMPYTFCFWNSIQLSKPSRVYIHSFWNSALQTYKSITNSQNNKRLSWIYL